MKGAALATLAYLVVTAVLFRELLANLRTHIYSDLGDPLLNASILAWNAAQTPLTAAWWNFPSFAPLTGVTVFTEHLLLTYPLATPIIRFTGNPILAYNIVFLLAPVLNGLSAYALARAVTGSRRAAFVGGLAYAFAPYQSAHLSHLQTMTAFGPPLALLGLHRYVIGGRRDGLALLGMGWLATTFANAYTLAFFPVLAALWCVWFVRPGEWRRLVAPAITVALCTLPVLPLLWGYRVRQAAYGLSREYVETQSFAADMVGLVGLYHRALPWQGLLPHDFEEGALFPGFAIAALAGTALAGRGFTPRRDRPPAPSRVEGQGAALRMLQASGVLTVIVLARIWTGPWGWHIGPIPLPPFSPYQLFTVAAMLFIAGVAMTASVRAAWTRRDAVIVWGVAAFVLWLLALGPEPEWSTPWRALVYGPYRLLMALPGFDSLRVPARMWLLAVLCLAMLVAFGVQRVIARVPHRAGVLVAALAAAILFEGWFVDGLARVPAPMPNATVPRGAVVLDLPMDQGFWNAVPQYRAVRGGYRSINGYSGYEPPHFLPLRQAIRDLNPHAFDSYLRVADLYVFLRPGETPVVAEWIRTRPGIEHLYTVGDTAIYRLPRLPSQNTVSTR
ncbi:MAG: glycosyltransferase family 39 protein [Acidimicrobiia bacterium]|nr:glycosyltransferase family 39 protein [Acidimicrobiia bacterium]